MYSPQYLLTAGFALFWIGILLCIVAIAFIYICYLRQLLKSQICQHNHASTQTEEALPEVDAQEAAANAVHLQENADQILVKIKTQQTHFDAILNEFNDIVSIVKTNDDHLQQHHTDLQKVISSFEYLANLAREHHQQMEQQLESFSLAFSQSNEVLMTQTKALTHIIGTMSRSLSDAKKKLSILPSFANLQQSLNHKTQRIKTLEKALSELNQQIKVLDKNPSSMDRRGSWPTYRLFKFTNMSLSPIQTYPSLGVL